MKNFGLSLRNWTLETKTLDRDEQRHSFSYTFGTKRACTADGLMAYRQFSFYP